MLKGQERLKVTCREGPEAGLGPSSSCPITWNVKESPLWPASWTFVLQMRKYQREGGDCLELLGEAEIGFV